MGIGFSVGLAATTAAFSLAVGMCSSTDHVCEWPHPVPGSHAEATASLTASTGEMVADWASYSESDWSHQPRAPDCDSECPFSVAVATPCHSWPFSARVVLRDRPSQPDYDVRARIVATDGRLPPQGLPIAVHLLPSGCESTLESFLVSPTAAVRVFADPASQEHLQFLSQACLELTYRLRAENRSEVLRISLGFPGFSSVVHSGFRLDRDAYSFENANTCFGMAISAALLFAGKASLPSGIRDAFHLPRETAEPSTSLLQASVRNRLGAVACQLSDERMQSGRMEWLKGELRTGSPAIMFLSEGGLSTPHVVLVRAVLEEPEERFLLIAIYDPDESFQATAGFHSDAFASVIYDAASGQLSYHDYKKYRLFPLSWSCVDEKRAMGLIEQDS